MIRIDQFGILLLLFTVLRLFPLRFLLLLFSLSSGQLRLVGGISAGCGGRSGVVLFLLLVAVLFIIIVVIIVFIIIVFLVYASLSPWAAVSGRYD